MSYLWYQESEYAERRIRTMGCAVTVSRVRNRKPSVSVPALSWTYSNTAATGRIRVKLVRLAAAVHGGRKEDGERSLLA